MKKPRWALLAGIGLSSVAMVLGNAPSLTHAADHFDAPGSFQSPRGRHDADIADVYAFRSPEDGSRSVLAMTTHPALGVVTTDPTYATDVFYHLHAGPITYTLQFLHSIPGFGQPYIVFRQAGARLTVLGHGFTNEVVDLGDGRAFAGEVSDPFFFDLDAFNNTVQARLDQRILPLNTHGETDGQACATTTGVDKFANFNSNVIALEVPNSEFDGQVGVWASTSRSRRGTGGQLDRMGRPAINTVFNGAKKLLSEGDDQDKNIFNSIVDPDDDATTATNGGGTFHDNVVTVLSAFDGLAQSLAGIPPRSAAALNGLANVLLPDVLPFDPSVATTNGVFNGRSPADDVIDNELPVVTNGLVTTDCVGPHADYRSTFPFFGAPH